jgi:hypothetical protein
MEKYLAGELFCLSIPEVPGFKDLYNHAVQIK